MSLKEIQSKVTEKLKEYDIKDDVLHRFTAVLINNKKSREDLEKEVGPFLGKNTSSFSEWAWNTFDMPQNEENNVSNSEQNDSSKKEASSSSNQENLPLDYYVKLYRYSKRDGSTKNNTKQSFTKTKRFHPYQNKRGRPHYKHTFNSRKPYRPVIPRHTNKAWVNPQANSSTSNDSSKSSLSLPTNLNESSSNNTKDENHQSETSENKSTLSKTNPTSSRPSSSFSVNKTWVNPTKQT
eukprot:gb/GECH01000451.1/.p1 GENE.gb/GECH01000451.1/~~gb/GECH01000451.1/.p1  ORF type:complete len:238 (+),score=77.18 gb/GECH01000451.1/:1-714(+)